MDLQLEQPLWLKDIQFVMVLMVLLVSIVSTMVCMEHSQENMWEHLMLQLDLQFWKHHLPNNFHNAMVQTVSLVLIASHQATIQENM